MLILPSVFEEDGLNRLPVFYWNHVAMEMNRLTHSLGGPQSGPTMSSRALGLLHLAMHDAYFTRLAQSPHLPYLDELQGQAGAAFNWTHAKCELAMTGAALHVLDQLYRFTGSGISKAGNETLNGHLLTFIRNYPGSLNTLDEAYQFGQVVAGRIMARLGVKPTDIGADQGHYKPKQDRYYFREEPSNPLKRLPVDADHPERGSKSVRTYHGPFYGSTVAPFATTPAYHQLAPPPKGDAAYLRAVSEVVAVGGAADLPGTVRTPDESVDALFWAYDGTNLIGSPPRLYNQIIRRIAWTRKPADDGSGHWDALATAEMVRLFALANAAMADAGKYAWLEKYRHELWRPLSGIREHDMGCGPAAAAGQSQLDTFADPFWRSLGAPETNTHNVSFKPPFPAYPSGHATFGAACFQMLRLFYKDRDGLTFDDNAADGIDFDFVSDELNGISRDLYGPFDPSLPIEEQPGLVRTRVRRRYPSLWHAIFANAVSRVYLGVHWHFDAFPLHDVSDEPPPGQDGAASTGRVAYRDPSQIQYSGVWTADAPDRAFPTGGVPLGLGIANEVWHNGLREPDAKNSAQPPIQAQQMLKASNTNIR